MQPKTSYFTTKIATGDSFCNRVNERKQLKNNVEKCRHTVIIAPRRYGKTSLVNQVLIENEVDYAKVSLLCAIYVNTICFKIAKGVSELVKQILPFTQKAIQLVEKCFKNALVVVKGGHFEIKIEFSKSAFDPITEIVELLQGLERLAEKQNKRVVLFLDEFQDVVKADNSSEIQAAIREIAQETQYLCIIFSGSSRRMLTKLFDDRNQPLYMLCQEIKLNRISRNDFEMHIQKAAKNCWNDVLDPAVIEKIFSTTELHPYYVNMLCDKLCENEIPPTIEDITSVWDECLLEKYDKVIADLEPLKANRLKTLSAIALLDEVREPNSKVFIDKVGLPLGTIQKCVSDLLKLDYIYSTQDKGLRVIDPLIKKFIKENF